MKTRGRRILSVVMITMTAITVAGILLRDAIASFVASHVLVQRGFECENVSVHLPFKLPPSPIEISPTRCKVTQGPLELVEFKEPLYLQLANFKLGLATCAELDVDLRPRAHREVEKNTLGDLATLAGADQPATELLFDSAELSAENNPPVLATHARLTRAGKPLMEFRDLRITSTDEGVIVTSPKVHVDQASLLGDGILRLVATPTAATVNVLFAGNLKVKAVLDHIDATKPKVDFAIAVDSTKPQQQSPRGVINSAHASSP